MIASPNANRNRNLSYTVTMSVLLGVHQFFTLFDAASNKVLRPKESWSNMMKTMNTGESLPDQFYVFLGRGSEWPWNAITRHNFDLSRGRLVSNGMAMALTTSGDYRNKFLQGDVDYLPFIPNPSHDSLSVSPFERLIANRYGLEYSLEIARKAYFKRYPSRFSCLYAFGCMEDCEKRADGHKWDLSSVQGFRLNLSEPLAGVTKVVKANTNYIGFLEYSDYPTFSPHDQDVLFRQYWECKNDYKIREMKLDGGTSIHRCDTLYEYLIEGVLEPL